MASRNKRNFSNKTARSRVVVAVATIGASMASTLNADFVKTPLERALQRSSDGPQYIYNVHYQSDEMVADYTVDPTQPEGSRVRVHSPAQQDWHRDFIEQIADKDENASSNILCGDFAPNIPPTATLVSESESTATYRFTPLAGDGVEAKDDRAIFPHMISTVTVDKFDPGILAFEMYAPEPFSPHWLVKISRMELRVSCARLPDGRTHVLDVTTSVEGLIALQPISQNEQWQVMSIHTVSP